MHIACLLFGFLGWARVMSSLYPLFLLWMRYCFSKKRNHPPLFSEDIWAREELYSYSNGHV